MFTQQYCIRVRTGQAVFVVNQPGASLAASASYQSSTEQFLRFSHRLQQTKVALRYKL